MAKSVTGKHPGGRPLKFKTPEDLERRIDEYMRDCPDKRKVTIKTDAGIEQIEIPCPTITGLALYLGFCDRQSMRDYEARPEFSCTIKKARSFIERIYEQLLQQGNCAGAIFALKNFGWKDTQNIDMTGVIKTANVDASKMTSEQLTEFINQKLG